MDIKLLYRLTKYLGFYKKDLIIVMISLFSVVISLLLIGNVFRKLIDYGVTENHQLSLNKSILYICILVFILGIGSFFRSYFINNIAEKIVNQIRKEVYNNLINYEIVTFEELRIGDIISCLTSDIELIAKLIVSFLSFFIRNSIMLIGAIVLMFFESAKLAAIIVIAIPLLLIPLMQFGKYVKKLSKTTLQYKGLITANIEETFTNIRAIHAFNQQINRTINFGEQLTLYLEQESSRLKVRALFFAIAIATVFIAITLVIWIGSIDIVNGSVSSGAMIAFIYYAIIAAGSSAGIFELFSEIHLPIAALERVFIFISSPSRANFISTKKLKFNNNIDIEFKSINFIYPARLNLKVINDISFTIPVGKFIGIVGRSGSGKSTLMQLLLKFYYQNSGTITIGKQDIANINSAFIRELIAYVPQETSIFTGTIKSNIIFANPSATDQEVEKVTTMTGIAEFVKKFPLGMSTEIGEKGIRLSGGQKQRIALARALIRSPHILLLDEATSSLDSESEQKLLNSIRQVMHKKTIISIAHRISGIEHADNIFVIDKGMLVAEGTHNYLLSSSEVYRAICQEQSKK